MFGGALLAVSSIQSVPLTNAWGAAQPTASADVIIRGGTIYPGGAAPFIGDVAIRGDRIVYVGPVAAGGSPWMRVAR